MSATTPPAAGNNAPSQTGGGKTTTVNFDPTVTDATPPAGRKFSAKKGSIQGDLVLYEDDANMNMMSLSHYLRLLSGVTQEDSNAGSGHGGKTKLGTLLGVYLPSIQHILGVQMFLRLLWIAGIAGLAESIVMLFICCLCTLLTSISISAIATNGKIESGGAYFMISRNLGPEFGGAIGVLFYLANTVATAMYLVGGVEILLVYMAPDLPQFRSAGGHGDESAMFNNFRIYGTVFLLVVFVFCAIGVKFVQLFAPISLAAVLLSILAVFVGSFVANPDRGPNICMLGDRLLKPHAFIDKNGTAMCNKNITGPLYIKYCLNDSDVFDGKCSDPYFDESEIHYISGIPGFSSGVMKDNAWSYYMDAGESAPGHSDDKHVEVVQDIATNWFVLLAIFFPSVTGIMTGANMSGDLKDPQQSIPIGTIAAQLTTSIIYLALVICYTGTIEGALLRDKYGESVDGAMLVAKLAWPNEWVLLVGSFLACIGAGLQCLCSAPRLLQSIAKDNIIPFLSMFSTLTKRNEPFRALLLSTLIAECGVLIGGIDYIAPVVDFFFLMSYCFVNIVCTLQTLLRAPNWRPRFKYFHWTLSLLGALLCLFIMFATYWYYAIVVMVLCGGLYKYIEYKGAKKEWGDGIRGLALSTAQYSLMKTESGDQHPKNWRPQLLVMLKLKEGEAGDNRDSENQKLLHLAGQLKAGRGLTMVGTLIEGDLSKAEDRSRADLAKLKLRRMMKDSKVKGFVEVVVVNEVSENVATVIQCVGMGGLRPNTIMVSWPDSRKDGKRNEEFLSFLDAIHRAASADRCLLVPKGLHMFPEVGDQLTGNIDVWWIMHDGGLLILLPFLLKQHKVWRSCKLRVFAVAQKEDNTVKMKKDLQDWVYQLRIDCTVDVVELADSTISAYTYERTLMMEERAKLASNLHMSARKMSLEPQMLADMARTSVSMPGRSSTGRRPSGNMFSAVLPKLFGSSDEVHHDPEAGEHKISSGSQPPVSKTEPDLVGNRGTVNPIFEAEENSDEANDTTNSKPKTEDENEEARDRVESINCYASHRTEPHRGKLDKQPSVTDDKVESERKKLRKLNTAMKLNKAIKEKSSQSRLVVFNLPRPPKARESLSNYVEYLEVMTQGLERVLLVRGSGKEIITIYS